MYYCIVSSLTREKNALYTDRALTKLKVIVSTIFSSDKHKMLYNSLSCILRETLQGCTQQSSTYFNRSQNLPNVLNSKVLNFLNKCGRIDLLSVQRAFY